jgi:hypothetical protein
VFGPELNARHEGVRDTGYTGGVDLVAAGKHQRCTPMDRFKAAVAELRFARRYFRTFERSKSCNMAMQQKFE